MELILGIWFSLEWIWISGKSITGVPHYVESHQNPLNKTTKNQTPTILKSDSRDFNESFNKTSSAPLVLRKNTKTSLKKTLAGTLISFEEEILRTKADLNQLRKFNENLLHFDKSIVTLAAQNEVKQFLRSDSVSDIHCALLRKNLIERLEAASEILR